MILNSVEPIKTNESNSYPIKMSKHLEDLLTDQEKLFFCNKDEVSFYSFINDLEQRDDIGDVLVVIRRALGLSLRDFARMIGVSHAYIDKIEKKRCAPTIYIIYAIADGLNIKRLKFIWLFTRYNV